MVEEVERLQAVFNHFAVEDRGTKRKEAHYPSSRETSLALSNFSFAGRPRNSLRHRICLVSPHGVGVVTTCLTLTSTSSVLLYNIELLTSQSDWTESTFTNFLAFVLPITTSWRLDAAPIMYRLFRQLGSYPYQTQPTSDALTFDQMAMAIQILLRRFSYFKVYFDTDGRTITNVPMKDTIFCRLLFQSLTASGTMKSGADPRGEDDDEDLHDVHKMLCEFSNRGIIDPGPSGGVIFGAGMPKGYHFPSSFSEQLYGRLPESELTTWFRMLVANRPGKPEKHDVEAEAAGIVTWLVVREFREQKSLSDGKIGWKAFSHVLAGKHSLMAGCILLVPSLRYEKYIV